MPSHKQLRWLYQEDKLVEGHTQDCEDYRFVHHACSGEDAECICGAEEHWSMVNESLIPTERISN